MSWLREAIFWCCPTTCFGEIRNTQWSPHHGSLLTKLDRCQTSWEATGQYSVGDKCAGMGVSWLSRHQQNHPYKQSSREVRFLPRASMISFHSNYLLGMPLPVDKRCAQSQRTFAPLLAHLFAAPCGIRQLVSNLVCIFCDRLSPCADGLGPSNRLLRRSKKLAKDASHARSIQQKLLLRPVQQEDQLRTRLAQYG